MAKRGKTGSHPQPKQQPSPAYSQALRLYWRGEKESALAALSDSLAEDGVVQPEALHRLWIEILAENQDPGSLRLLLEYLNRQVDFQHPSWIPTFSLIGLIHYELGEREAAQIIQRSLRRHAAHPYCRELDLVLSLADDEAKALHLGRLLVRQSTDYFHHKRCILLSHQQGQFALTQRLLSQLEAVFGSQPLRSEIAFHDAFGQKNYRQAWQHALALRQEFPVHAEYQFFYAYTSYLIDRNKLALHEFLQLNRRHEAEDPDVLSLIGAALLHDGKEPSPRAKARSCHYLQRAIARLKAMGLPTAYPQNLLHRIEGTAVVNSGRYWIVKLSPRQCLELYNRPLERLSYLHRAMGDHVKRGTSAFLCPKVESPMKTTWACGKWWHCFRLYLIPNGILCIVGKQLSNSIIVSTWGYRSKSKAIKHTPENALKVPSVMVCWKLTQRLCTTSRKVSETLRWKTRSTAKSLHLFVA
ncbi:MAG: hypothetical protein ACOVS5_04630 [Oligoflexus sp.]